MFRSFSPVSNFFFVSIFLLCLIAASLQVEAYAQTTPPVEAGKELAAELGCFECHGKNGVGVTPDTPNLAGQDRSYLIRQLENLANPETEKSQDFLDSGRHHMEMESSTRNLAYDQISRLSVYFSSLRCIPRSVPDAAAIPGEVKACARCHGLYGINIKPGVPDLSGQKAFYLKQQLRAFRASRFGVGLMSQDQVRYHDVMEDQAVPLSDVEIDIIVDYFAALDCG